LNSLSNKDFLFHVCRPINICQYFSSYSVFLLTSGQSFLSIGVTFTQLNQFPFGQNIRYLVIYALHISISFHSLTFCKCLWIFYSFTEKLLLILCNKYLSYASLTKKQNTFSLNTYFYCYSKRILIQILSHAYDGCLLSLISNSSKKKNTVNPCPCNFFPCHVLLPLFSLVSVCFLLDCWYFTLYLRTILWEKSCWHNSTKLNSGNNIPAALNAKTAVFWGMAPDSEGCVPEACSFVSWWRVNNWQWYIILGRAPYSVVRLKTVFEHIIYFECRRNFQSN
jgi:hypothetical protein